MRLVVRVARREKGGALKYKTRTQQYLAVRTRIIPGTRHIARSFGKLGQDEQSVGGPDRLPSAIMLDAPGQRLMLHDGPCVQLRRVSEHCVVNREILEGISKLVNANASRFFLGW